MKTLAILIGLSLAIGAEPGFITTVGLAIAGIGIALSDLAGWSES